VHGQRRRANHLRNASRSKHKTIDAAFLENRVPNWRECLQVAGPQGLAR
jgi:hypothetical protein